MELERLRDRFKGIGLYDVATDLEGVLQKHLGTLPPHLPGYPISTGELPLDKSLVEDPGFLRELLEFVLPFGMREEDKPGLLTVTYYTLLRESGGRSLAELMSLSEH